MTTARASNEIMSLIIIRTRVQVGDPATTPAGDTRSILKFADSQYLTSINDTIKELMNEADILEGDSISPVDFTYTESATNTGMVFTGSGTAPIIAVEDITAGTQFGRLCTPILPEQISYYNTDAPVEGLATNYFYALTGEGNTRNILIKPRSANGRQFRIWYMATPLIHTVGSDTVLLSDRFAELIALGAAISLLMIDGEATQTQLDRYEVLKRQYLDFVGRYRGPKHIKQVRR